MAKFQISGFADEIDADLETQLKGFNELGIDFIEIRGVNGKNISTLSPGELAEVKSTLQHYGVQVSSIGSPIGKINITDGFAAHLDMAKRIFEIAHNLNSSFVRIFSFYMPKGVNPAVYRAEVIDRISAILESAEGSDLTILHENEKDIYGDIPERCLDLMEACRAPHFASVFDPANFVQCGSEVFPAAFELLKPYIQYVHIKDALEDGSNVPAGMGAGRIDEVLKRLKADGYEGFLSLEPHLGSFAGLAGLELAPPAAGLKASGLDTFRLAHSSLLSILSKI